MRSDEPHRKRGLPWWLLALLGLLLLLALAVALYFLLRGDDDKEPAAASPPPASAPASPAAPSAAPSAGGTSPSAAPGAGTGGAGAGGTAATGAAAGAGGLVGGALTPAVPASGIPDGAALAAPGTLGTVLFGSDSAELTDSGRQVVANAVQQIRSTGARSVSVTGYTDVVGGQPVNSTLSQERADTVASQLRQELGGQVEVTTSARGQEDPVVPNDTDAHRQLNRRATISAR